MNMEVLNDAELMENVRKRFARDLIFTYVGPTLLVVNPFKKIDQMGTEEMRMTYIKHIIPAKDPLAYKEKPPNVYAIAWYLNRIYDQVRPTVAFSRTRRTNLSSLVVSQELERRKMPSTACHCSHRSGSSRCSNMMSMVLQNPPSSHRGLDMQLIF